MEDITADQFLSFAHQFKLGCLQTQQQNPKTIGLSQLATHNLPQSVEIIRSLDVDILNILRQKIPQLQGMQKDVSQCLLSQKGRIFICGCGATGRLSLVLETIWRQEQYAQKGVFGERVVAFMAGGDSALIKSIEDFEDHPEFAQQHLIELGFTKDDLLIGSTQGGETSWVIGAIWKATQISTYKPYILYGNSDQVLAINVQRSRKYIESDKIIKINCNVGQMALAGSTRMQSTTILMHAIGLCLFGASPLLPPQTSWTSYAEANISTLMKSLLNVKQQLFVKLIETETSLYKRQAWMSYATDPYYAITVLTDTTERSPTFSLSPIPNKLQPDFGNCWCTLNLKVDEQVNTQSQRSEVNWRELLGKRQLRGLQSAYWAKYQPKVSKRIIYGFNLSDERPNQLVINCPFSFAFFEKGAVIQKVQAPVYPTTCRLSHHSLLKMILNNVSTLIMGRMNRYESNIMTYVRPTNYKLIDRAARYVILLKPEFGYEDVIKKIFAIKNTIRVDQPIVLEVIKALQADKTSPIAH